MCNTGMVQKGDALLLESRSPIACTIARSSHKVLDIMPSALFATFFIDEGKPHVDATRAFDMRAVNTTFLFRRRRLHVSIALDWHLEESSQFCVTLEL